MISGGIGGWGVFKYENCWACWDDYVIYNRQTGSKMLAFVLKLDDNYINFIAIQTFFAKLKILALRTTFCPVNYFTFNMNLCKVNINITLRDHLR